MKALNVRFHHHRTLVSKTEITHEATEKPDLFLLNLS